MSLPIRPTPILRGKDAEAFLKSLKENEHKKIPKEERERAKHVREILEYNSTICDHCSRDDCIVKQAKHRFKVEICELFEKK